MGGHSIGREAWHLSLYFPMLTNTWNKCQMQQ